MGRCQAFMLSLCRQTDGQVEKGKTICPQSFDTGHKNAGKGENAGYQSGSVPSMPRLDR